MALFLLLGCVVNSVWGQSWILERRPSGIQVFGEAGNHYAIPFGGGLNAPQFQFADIDGDLDLDLFVQEEPDEFAFYRNTGTPGEAEFTWETDRFNGIASGSWFRFEDIDGDNDLDLFTERPFNKVSFFLNAGNAAQPHFILAAETLVDTSGVAVESEIGTPPSFVDIDCDGDPDYFAAKADGTITSYTLVAFDQDGIPRFSLDPNGRKFAGIVLPDSYCGPVSMSSGSEWTPDGKNGEKKGSNKHGAAAMTFFDANADELPDIFWGDAFTNGVLFFPNIGTCENPDFAFPAPGGFVGEQNEAYPDYYFPPSTPVVTSGLNYPSFSDINGDGFEDFFSAPLSGFCPDNGNDPVENFHHYQGSSAGFTLQTKRFLTMIDIGTDASPVLHDVDGDNDLDLVIGSAETPFSEGTFGRIFLFENTGSASQPAFRLVDEDFADLSTYYFPGSGLTAYNLAPAFADIDGDFDDDLFVGLDSGYITFFRNDGSSYTRVPPQNFGGIDVGDDAVPAFADLDGDEDLDILIGNRNGRIHFYRNDGSKTSAQFTLVTDFLASIDVGFRAAPALVDADGDLDLDLLVGNESGEIRYWRNDGSLTSPLFVPDDGVLADAGQSLRPTAVDIDADGDADLFAGSGNGGVFYFENASIVATEPVSLPLSSSLNVEIWPNPARVNDAITIRILSSESTTAVVEVFNPVGQRLFKKTVVPGYGTTDLDWSALTDSDRSLAAGIYFVQVTQNSQRVARGLILSRNHGL